MSRQHRQLDVRRWAEVRRIALDRDGHRCRRCRKFSLKLEVDHVTPLHRGGAAYELGNVQVLCAACHHRKSEGETLDADRVAWRQYLRAMG